ncbi:hypothetical protein [Hymenobacter rigui]
MAEIDSNVKGTGKHYPEFHSPVLGPSQDELLLIGNNAMALE